MNGMDNMYEAGSASVDASVQFATPVGAESSNLQTIIKRIRECVEMETRAIQADSRYDAKQLNSRKSRLLYELGRAGRGLNPADFDNQCRKDFAELRKALAENESVLRAHISAVSEVASIVQDAIQRDETDGTYTAGEFAEQYSV